MGSDEFSVLKDKYTYQVPAEALFFSGRDAKAFRLEVAHLGREFTDNAHIGKDPEGTLFFNHYEPFDSTSSSKYQVKRYINPSDGKVTAWVQFYHTKPSDGFYAEFLAYDPEETVNGAGMDGWSDHLGNWKVLDIACATAKVEKWEDDSTIVLTANSIRKTASISQAQSLTGTQVVAQGQLFFKDFNTLSTGKYANYNNDRIVFYTSNGNYDDNYVNSTDFVAYFIPFDRYATALGSQSTQVWGDITWGNI